MRSALVTALLACSDNTLRRKTKARRFLQGLSSDELQFIAEYLGSRILESTGARQGTPDQLMGEFQNFSYTPSLADQEHKMILLLEYLRRSGSAMALRA